MPRGGGPGPGGRPAPPGGGGRGPAPHHGFAYRRPEGEDLAELLPGLVREATGGHGADVVLDVVGGSYLDANVRSLATGGALVVIGTQRGSRGELDLGRLMAQRARVVGTTLRSRPPADKARIVAEVAARVWPMLDDGRLRPVFGKVLLVT